MKKVYLLFLLALLPLLASAETVEINGIRYNVNPEAKTAEVIQPSSGKYSGDIVIPKSVTFKNTVCKVTSIGYNAFHGCSGLTSVTIPANVTSIGGNAFSGCRGLTSVIIPASVTSIGYNAFLGCDGLTSVTIPNSVTSIGSSTFGNCSGLTSITIPNSVTSIGDYAFYGCRGLTSVTISNNVISINEGAFRECNGLTSVTIPNSVTCIGDHAFDNCYNLTSVTIPNSVTSIGNYAFYGCRGLTSVTIPNSVTCIGEWAFYDCSGLTSITIGSGVTYIFKGAFSHYLYYNLTDVYCMAENVPTTSSDNFTTCNIEYYVTLHVPNGCSAAYKAVEPWKNFKTIVEMVDAKVKLSKTKATIEKGKTLTLKATVTPSELIDKSVKWKSSNTKVATVTSAGKVKGIGAGTATITCTSNATGKSATCKVTVAYVTLNKTETFVKKGKTVTLTPTVYPTTLADQSVTWSSSDTNIATVSSAGKVKGVKVGTATITCTSVTTGLSTTCKVTVGAVTLDKTKAAIKKGKSVTLTAKVYPSTLEDKSVTWKSSNTAVATVTSTGKVKGIKLGTATITCTSVATGLSATCTVTVGAVTLDRKEMVLEKGKTTTLTAKVYPSTLEDKSVTWTSSDTKIATVSSSGKVKGVGYGTATITCTSVATGVSATCQVTIGKVVLNTPEFTLRKTRTLTLVATLYPTTLTDKSVTWKSSDTKVATVSSSGKVKGVGAGTATITCTSVATGLKGTCTVTVLAASESRSIEGDDDEATGIDEVNIESTEAQPYDVYDLSGRKVAHQVTTLEGLPNGIYIVNGKKMLKK